MKAPPPAEEQQRIAALAAAQLESRLSRVELEVLAETTRLNEELAALVSVTDCAISTLDLQTLLEVLVERLVKVMKADAGAILLEEHGQLVVRAMRGFGGGAGELPPIPMGDGFGGRIAASRRPLYIADARSDQRVLGDFLRERGVVSMLGVPLQTRVLFVGVLHVDWCEPHAESASDVHLLQIAAERCATAIVNARLFGQLRVAHTDVERVKDRLMLALRAADLGVWDWHLPSGAVVWDASNERIFGLPPGGYDGTLETFRRFVHPEDLDRLQRELTEAMGGAQYAPRFRIVRPDGEVRWLSVRGHVQRAPDGSPLRLLGVTADVTEEHHRAEERELLLVREQGARREAERAEAQLRALRARVESVREEESLRMAREIHDELGQLLTALKMDISWLKKTLAKTDASNPALLERTDAMYGLADRTIAAVQRISEQLRPPLLDELGLEAAIGAQLDELRERCGIETSLEASLGDLVPDPTLATAAFRITQELLTNVARHSGARAVAISLTAAGGWLEVRVRDDGRGITPREVAAQRSLGILGMRERALLLGGALDIAAMPGGGTEAVVRLPARVAVAPA